MILVFLGYSRHAVKIVQYVVTVANGTPDVLLNCAGRIICGVVAPKSVVRTAGRLLPVHKTFIVKPAGCTPVTHNELIGSGGIRELLGMKIIRYFLVAANHHLLGLRLRFVNIVYRGSAFGHHVKIVARGKSYRGNRQNEVFYVVKYHFLNV